MTELVTSATPGLRGGLLVGAAILLGAATGLTVAGVAWFEASVINIYAPGLSSDGRFAVLASAALIFAAWRTLSLATRLLAVDVRMVVVSALLVLLGAMATSGIWAIYAVIPGAAIGLVIHMLIWMMDKPTTM